MGPIFEKLSTKYGDSGIKFLKVDVDDNPESANKFSVSAIPTFCFIQDGKLVDQIRGADPAGLERKIAEFGSK
ncbi:thioredoxin [Hyaloraphidium curvatum]|nr:thioredoxin [Hyaloraphidium curvatum]